MSYAKTLAADASGDIVSCVSCTKIDYVGEEFPPTDRVDQYFSAADVTKDYKVMGYIVASAPDMVSAEKMHKKLVEKAQKVGADGIIIEGLERYTAGSSTSLLRNKSGEGRQKGKSENGNVGKQFDHQRREKANQGNPD